MSNFYSKLRKLLRCIAEMLSLIIFTPLGRFMRLVSPKWRNVWLISERGREARDNGWHFFCYVVREHPEIHAVFSIDKHSPDLEKVRKAGPVVYRSSLRHRLLMGAAARLISTHLMGYTPDLGAYFRLDRLKLVPGIKVFLQHGITKDNMTFMRYPNTRCDLFVCAAKDEFTFVRDHFGHKDGVVQLLGFCRYDALYDAKPAKKRQILLMPTWREWLALHDAGDFTQNAYFQSINGLIDSPKLAKLLDEYDYELAFYPHFEMHRFLNLFHSACPRVKILGLEGNDVQQLLIESQLLVTDFSSVFFDVGYMGKPIVYYQFDEAEFRARQYSEGYFSYRRDGFGPVCVSLDDTLDAIKEILDRDCHISEGYQNRIDSFFTLRDSDNCRRNFEAVAALKGRLE